MHVTLLHKPTSGDESHSERRLIALFEDHGHIVTYHSTDDDAWPSALDAPADCVVAAGGDGTVASVATRLVGRGVPLAILPLGTANNIATRLGLCREPEALASSLAEATPRPFDVGVAEGPWGSKRFVEGIGLGAFTRTIAFARTESGLLVADPDDREESLERDLRLLRAVLRDLDVHHGSITLDGEEEEVAYLLLEVSNTGLIGPNVALTSEADCGDGLFDVVVAGEAERTLLERYLEARLRGDALPPPALPVRQARQARLSVEGTRIHIDDDVWPKADEPPPASDEPYEVEVRIEPGALAVLSPA